MRILSQTCRIPAALFAVLASSTPLSAAAQSLFDYSMQVQDLRFDDYYKYIRYQEVAGELSTRFTAWYTAGLLYRNQGNDVENAKAAIENILRAQMTAEYDSAWYGTYKVTLDGPVPTDNSSYWPPEIYTTYDPNWREFVGTQLVQVVELYADLLGDDLVSRIEDALEMAAVGEIRRNGSYPAGDNLILAYTNPGLMRCLTVGWIGARRNNATYINFANQQGNALLALFRANGSNTFGEYNAPTYYGMDIWALAANIAYGPANATMTSNARYLLTHLWEDIAAHYNPYLRNLAGPYDRAYTRDMTAHSAVLSLWWWGLFGREYGGQPVLGEADLLYDVAQGAALAQVVDVVAAHISDEAAAALQATGKWEGSRLLNRTVRESLDTDVLRVATSWVSAEVMMGAEALAETVNRGAQFVPAIVHWASDPARTPSPYVGFFSLYPSASTVDAVVTGPGALAVSYPNTTQAGTEIFTFAVSGIPPGWTLDGNRVTGLEGLPCLAVNVSAPGLVALPVTASASVLEDHYYYNVSWVVPEGFEGVPGVSLEVAYTC
ncbi:hypothetical protein M406DRAFT_336623 [Cryphonectria parasitica EP155]|uniref:Uncharacterized protein n=1 Tax=Cryphonectria parasitica (strain ATCC 38755 / EP155) TaxID=660469 RepID=A0A9P4YD03_CRYP1|nr:uncharacterized protein M406DRAFT_336623 [Cryphonectria parasitica EP155]KAF3771106.1 hypothetical protein M406DRAFT_336623 [Cryphonectria parasitica EP155]